jgi:dnd system-associated protein 4
MTAAKAASSNAIGMKRIHRATDKEELIKELAGDSTRIFGAIWKLLLFAAQIGVANQRREPLAAVDSGKGIDQSTFSNCSAWPGVVYLMALVESGHTRALTADAEEERIALFEQYANGGLSMLQEFFRDRSINLDGLLEFITAHTAKVSAPPNLDLSI